MRAFGLPLLVGHLLLVFGLCPAAIGQVAVVDFSSANAVPLPIGDALLITWASVSPGEELIVRLIDEGGSTVVSSAVTSDGEGHLDPFALWPRTGVVGCDEGSDPNPAVYRFETYAEARDILLGRTFSVWVEDLEGIPWTSQDVTIAPARSFFYFSNASGCPRSFYETWETLYLAASNPGGTVGPRQFFLTDLGTEVPCVGDTLVDLRSNGSPQQMAAPPGQGWVVLGPVAEASELALPSTCRQLLGVVREASEAAESSLMSGDVFPQRGPVVPCWEEGISWAGSTSVGSWKPAEKGPCD